MEAILEIIKFLGGIFVLLILIELLDLPEPIGKKNRGEKSKKDLENKIEDIESRLEKLERKMR